MVRYSHSRLSTFEQCPYRYKLKYLDKMPPEIEATIEGHLGTCIHLTLEWLYKNVLEKNIPTLDEVILNFTNNWDKHFSPKIVVIKEGLTYCDYFQKGVSFLIDYYSINSPFEEGTLELEKEILFPLDDEGNYEIWGFIDRVCLNPKTGEYEIHDYKTANFLPSQEKMDCDRQLALYIIGLKKELGLEENTCVKLIWHYLAHKTKICSKRNLDELEKLKKETLDLIKKIEETKNFEKLSGTLCNWCEYKNYCKNSV